MADGYRCAPTFVELRNFFKFPVFPCPCWIASGMTIQLQGFKACVRTLPDSRGETSRCLTKYINEKNEMSFFDILSFWRDQVFYCFMVDCYDVEISTLELFGQRVRNGSF
jgi:hypothetical protein